MLVRSLALSLCSGLSFAASFPVLTYSTYLRDSFTPNAIATDSSGNIYMAGNAIVDPLTMQTTALIVKLNPQANGYLYMRYLGGSVNDNANAIAVDNSGNVYVAGTTTSPDFQTTNINTVLSPAPGPATPRSFVAKFDSNGELIFSNLLGGTAMSSAQAVAVNGSEQVLVTGIVNVAPGPAFPTTPGAYSIPNTANHPYLLELDITGKIIFSATGIGGNAIALDAAGNIYVAGTTSLLDYPTTPGAYQSKLPVFTTCFAPCDITFQGLNQYVTKVDPTGSKLIYSTAVSGTGNTVNGGLAVDAAGNVYLTGYDGSNYPYSVTPPAITSGDPLTMYGLPFLSKLDPAGQTLLFSVPIGGAGVAVDAHGTVYVGGGLGSRAGIIGFHVSNVIPALAGVPASCLPNNMLIGSAAYVAQVDGSSGSALGSQFIGGSGLTPSAVALSGATVWIAGSAGGAVPFTPNALTLPNLAANPPAGAYLGAVDFSKPQPPAGTPQIGCIVDSADFAPVSAAARYQLLTIVGTGLGPSTGVSATDNTTTALAGVTVNFGGIAAPLLYVSSTQINLAVPLVAFNQAFSPIEVTVNQVNAAPLALPLTYSNPSLFLDFAQSSQQNPPQPVAVALNADGSQNSSTNPAQLGSAIAVFVNGLTPDPLVTTAPPQFSTDFGWSVNDFVQATPFVIRVDLQVPTRLVDNFACFSSSLCLTSFAIFNTFTISSGPQSMASSGQAMGAMVFVK